MKSRVILVMALVAALATVSQAVPWFEDTIETDSPAVAWINPSTTHKYMANSGHGDGTLAPHGGGYKVASTGDQLHKHQTSGSHFTGISHGLWSMQCAYTLLADPTNSHSGLQQARMDVKFLGLSTSPISIYFGEVKSNYADLAGTTADLVSYANVQFKAGSAGKVSVRPNYGTWLDDALDLSWGITYRIFTDFDTDADTFTMKICDDADGLNALVSFGGSVDGDMTALNGWQVTCFGAAEWGQDNFVMEQIPEPATIGLLCLGGVALLRRRK